MPLSICARRSTRVPRARSGASSESSPCRIRMRPTTRAHRHNPRKRSLTHGQKSENQRPQKRSETAHRQGRAPESQAQIRAQGAQESGLSRSHRRRVRQPHPPPSLPPSSRQECPPVASLTDIRGIGPAMARALDALGITGPETLARATPATLTEVRGISPGRAQGFIAAAQALTQARDTPPAPRPARPAPAKPVTGQTDKTKAGAATGKAGKTKETSKKK